MINLVDQALRGPLFERAAGLASSDVTLADPAVGTGTFLLGVLRRIAANVEADQGAGAVGPAIAAAAKRLFGFELQFGPFAVAQLRLLAEMRALTKAKKATPPELNLFITDTLGNPFVEEEQLPQIVEAIAKSRREANKVKREQPITVVIGNPPYKEKAEGRGGWIEKGADGKLHAPLDRWKAPRALGRRRARQAPQEPLRLFLALGDAEGLRLRPLRRDRPAGYGRRRNRLFHHGRRLSQRAGLRENARRPAPDVLGHLGDRLFAGGPSAGRADAHLPGRAAAGLHRARGAQARKG